MTITRTLVSGGLSAARLPLTVAERALQRGEPAPDWPPTLAFDALSATVKQVVGALSRDPQLADDGRLMRARVGQIRRGEELDTLAETLKAEADAELSARRDVDARRRRDVQATTASRKRKADEAAAREAEHAAKVLADREASATRADTKTRAAATRRERSARSERLRAERTAIAQDKRALDSERLVEKIDTELEAAKATRRRSHVS